jgi:L-ribulokinase
MTIVAGVDFGTLSVRVSVLDSERGRLGTAVAEYPLHRRRQDPDYATQAHADHMRALTVATRLAVKEAGIRGEEVKAIALDTTGSSVVPVDAQMQPLNQYYLWCDHRAKSEAQQIIALAHREDLEAFQWCGGVYSHEWGFAKLLHWLRHTPGKRDQLASSFEHCDMVAATLCGVTEPKLARRSVLPWATNGRGIQSGMACHRSRFSPDSIRFSTAFAKNLRATTSHRIA